MTDTPLERLARRASAEPFFLGFRLAEFARVHDLDDQALAARLGCDLTQLPAVRLCRAPRSGRAEFREDVLCVARTFGLNPWALADAAKYEPATLPEKGTAEIAPVVMIAARDREDPS